MATDSKDSRKARRDTWPASIQLTPSEIVSLRESFRELDAEIVVALANEHARRAKPAAGE